jgi:hypothetical protein
MTEPQWSVDRLGPVEYPRVGMPGGGWPGTGRSVRAAVAAGRGR